MLLRVHPEGSSVSGGVNGLIFITSPDSRGLPKLRSGKESACLGRRHKGSVSGSGRFPGGGNGNLLQYACLYPMDRGVWLAIVLGAAKSWT